ncbi:MAG: ferritin [Candidatus Glassbacteria bacterium]|nr:ferritin [Candidatus Glassbacteria bacterium]
MLSKKMQAALNDQIQSELYSSYLYLSMSSWFKAQNLEGFAGWLEMQAQEEMGHVMKFYGYLHDKGADVELQALPAPQKSWKSPLAVFQDTLKHEQMVTGRINDLCALADSNNDNATRVLLNWFVEEQVEEEASAQAVIDKLKMVEGYPGGIYLIDKEMGGRTVAQDQGGN